MWKCAHLRWPALRLRPNICGWMPKGKLLKAGELDVVRDCLGKTLPLRINVDVAEVELCPNSTSIPRGCHDEAVTKDVAMEGENTL